jgi:hypothetical protein
MKHSTKFGIDACGDHDGRLRVCERLLQRWATLNRKLRRKEFFPSFEMRLTVFCLFVALTAGAQSMDEHLPVTDGEKIADALRAAPKFITDGATIVDYPASKGGEFRVLRKGTSEWTCLPGPPPGSKHDDPGCFDRVFFQWVKDDLAGRPQHIERLGVSYMFMGQWVPGAVGGEFHVGPHIMLVTPHPQDLQGFTRGGWNGTYIIHLPGADQADKWFLVIPVHQADKQ